MNHPFAKPIAALVALLLLTSCGGVTIGPVDPPTVDREITSRTDTTSPVDITLAAGETKFIQVNVPSGQRSVERRLVVEADDDEGATQLDLVLYGPNGVTPTASTSGTAFFRPGLLGLGQGFIGTSAARQSGRDAPGEVTRSVSVVGECFGPCIARTANVSVVYVELTNTSTFDDVVPFYAYTEEWIDPGETQNDSLAGAVAVSQADAYRGAIERLGDVDYVRFTQAGNVIFDERPGYDVNLVLDLYGPGGTFIRSVRPGAAPFDVFANEYAVIRSASPSRASVYGFYDVYYGN
jgi:hypothetical protein